MLLFSASLYITTSEVTLNFGVDIAEVLKLTRQKLRSYLREEEFFIFLLNCARNKKKCHDFTEELKG